MLKRNDPCFCGSGKKWKKCHAPELPPGMGEDLLATRYQKSYGIILKTKEQIEGIRRAGHLAADILMKTCAMAKAGVTTDELNTFAAKLYKEAGAIAATVGYGHPPFPKGICTSLNDVICHGIPDNTTLKDGDILNIDVTCILDGYYGDCSKMVTIGAVSEEKQLVVDVAYECLMRSIEILKPGVMVHAIGAAITDHAHAKNCSVVDQFVGHGVGVEFHEAPQVPHHRNRVCIPLEAGMTFTIEPMINAGEIEAVIDPDDMWTARTIDGKPSAQFEHTILITETGHEILTPWKR